MKWWIFVVLAVFILGIYAVIDVPLFKECKSHGFGDYYCFFQLK